MPSNVLKNIVTASLSDISYRRVNFEGKPVVVNTFKESLLDGSRMSVSILGPREFEVKVDSNYYYLVLATDFWFSYQKVVEQRRVFCERSIHEIPSTWLIVTAYYSSFYSAVQLARLCGFYNLYLKSDHCSSIMEHASGSQKLDKGNYNGAITQTDDYITLRFCARDKSQPHELAWSNIGIMLNKAKSNVSDQTKMAVVELLQRISQGNERNILSPNNVRNEWNYSYPNAYDFDFCSDIKEAVSCLAEPSRKRVMSWPRTYKKNQSKNNNVMMIVYFETVLAQVMKDVSIKMYNQ